MKEFIAILLILIVSKLGYSQNSNLIDTVYYDKNWKEITLKNYKYYRIREKTTIQYEDTTLTKVIDHYRSGKIQMTGYISALNPNIKLGLYQYFKKNGTIKYIEFYNLNKLQSKFNTIENYLNQINLKDSTNSYLYISFYHKGHIKSIGFYSHDCIKIGTWTEYNLFNKKMKYTYEYKDGIFNGTNQLYYSNGNKFYEKQYSNGKLNGTWKSYNYKGNLVKEKTYYYGKRNK